MHRLLEVAALVAGLAALGFLCWRFGLNDLGAALAQMTPAYLCLYLACGCAARFGSALRWQMVARRFEKAPSLLRLVGARLAGDAAGSLLPAGRIGGDPVRMVLVYGDHIGAARAAAGVATDRILETIGNMLCAVAYVAVFLITHTVATPHGAVLTLVVTMVGLLVLLAIPVVTLRHGRHPLSLLYRLIARYGSLRSNAWAEALRQTERLLITFFRDHPGAFVSGLLGSLAIEALMVGEFYFLLATFGLGLDVPTLLMALVAGGIARNVPTPGGLGAVEASQVTVVAAAVGRADVGFVIGMVLRLHDIFWVVVGLLAFSLQGFPWARLRLMAAARKPAV